LYNGEFEARGARGALRLAETPVFGAIVFDVEPFDVEHSYQVHYRDGRTGAAGFMVLSTAAKADGEKRRLERLGFIVTGILPPTEGQGGPAQPPRGVPPR
jgi:hypothetical protein